jgi:DNA-binding XRE family transcriptional regulator
MKHLKGGDAMRMNLKLFRVSQKMTTEEMSKRIGCQRSTYSAIEAGKRDGRVKFWYSLQDAFGLENSELGELMQNEQE